MKAELLFCLELVRVAWGLPALVSAVASLAGVDAQTAGEMLWGLTKLGGLLTRVNARAAGELHGESVLMIIVGRKERQAHASEGGESGP